MWSSDVIVRNVFETKQKKKKKRQTTIPDIYYQTKKKKTTTKHHPPFVYRKSVWEEFDTNLSNESEICPGKIQNILLSGNFDLNSK